MKLGKKITGGKIIQARKKKKFEGQGQKRIVKIGEDKRKTTRVVGGNKKTFLLRTNSINVDLGDKKQKVEIKNVLETPSNRFLARQNVMTKGTVVDTELGQVRITNRPTQEGNVNGVLVK